MVIYIHYLYTKGFFEQAMYYCEYEIALVLRFAILLLQSGDGIFFEVWGRRGSDVALTRRTRFPSSIAASNLDMMLHCTHLNLPSSFPIHLSFSYYLIWEKSYPA